MTRLYLLLCVCLVLGGVLVYQMQHDSGYFLLVWGNYSVEMSIWFFLAFLLVVFYITYISLVIVRGSFKSIHATKEKFSSYSANKAQQQTLVGLIAFIEGDWKVAHRKLTRAARHSSSPIINYLAAARCAFELNDEQAASQLLHSAEKSATDSGLAVALTQARMQLSGGQYEQALATLARAESISPNHSVVLSLLQQVYVAVKDWDALKKLLPKLHKGNMGSVKERYHLEKNLYQQCFFAVIEKNKTKNDEEKLSAIHQCWIETPEHFQQDEAILSAYVGELIALKKYALAEIATTKGLSKQWCDHWVLLFGFIHSLHPESALKKAERWLKTNEKNAILQLTLGRLCLQNKQWGRAKDFFLESLRIEKRSDTYAELARLQAFLGEEKESQESHRQGLLHAVDSLIEISEFADNTNADDNEGTNVWTSVGVKKPALPNL